VVNISLAWLLASLPLLAADNNEHQHAHDVANAQPADTRQVVNLPEPLRTHMLANMRDHLLTLHQIQEALAKGWFDKASDIAEQRLGLTSLKLHGAQDVGRYMPEGMQSLGTEMHKAASRFAIEAQDASVTGDMRPALEALSLVTEQCVACHSAYRIR
jgi:hypothetical protein